MMLKSEELHAEIKSGTEIFEKYSSYATAIKSVATIEERNNVCMAIDIDDYLFLQKVFMSVSEMSIIQESELSRIFNTEKKRKELEERHTAELDKSYFEKDFLDNVIDRLGIKTKSQSAYVDNSKVQDNSEEHEKKQLEERANKGIEAASVDLSERIKGRKHNKIDDYYEGEDLDSDYVPYDID